MQCAQAARVGILTSGQQTAAAGDLLTATLSREPGIELLERVQLDKIAAERALSVAHANAAASALGADALMFLEASGPSTNVRANLRVVAVKKGIVLYSTELKWPPADVAQWVDNISPKIVQAAKKSAVPVEKATKLSVLNLRSAINSPSQQLLERELTALLLTRLAQEPELFVLERRALAAAQFEKDLAADEEKFWTGSHLLDGTINREKFDPKRVTISARLRAPNGEENTLEVEGSRDQLGKVIEDLVGKILAALKVEKRAVWDPQKEAAQHLLEANWALKWGMWKEAQAAADSAWALGAQSLDAAATRMLAYARDSEMQIDYWYEAEDKRLRWPSRPPAPESVDPPFQAIALLQDVLAARPEAITNQTWWAAARESLDLAGKVVTHFYWRAEAREPVQQKLADLRTLWRGVAETLVKDPVIRKDYWFAPGENRSPDRMEDYHRENKDFFSIYLRRANLFYEQPEDTAAVFSMLIHGDAFPYIRRELYDDEVLMVRLGGWRWADRKRGDALWKKLIADLNASTNVLIQIEGKLLAMTAIPKTEEYLPEGSPLVRKMTNEVTALVRDNHELILNAPSKRKFGEVPSDPFDLRWSYDLDQEFFRAYDRRNDIIKVQEVVRFMREKRPFDFRALAPAMNFDYSTNQAMETLAAVKEYRREVIDKESEREQFRAKGILDMLERSLSQKAGVAPPPPKQVASLPRTNRPPMLTNRPGMMLSNGIPRPMTGRFPPNRPFGMPGWAGRTNEPPVETIHGPTLRVDRFWRVPIEGARADLSMMDGGMSLPLVRDGKLWVHYSYNPTFSAGRPMIKSSLMRVDVKRFAAERVFPLEGEGFSESRRSYSPFDQPPRVFEILNGNIFVLGDDALLRKSGNSSTWEKLPLPGQGGDLWRVGTNLYWLAADSLHQIDPNSGNTKTLASVRRRPPESILDELETLAKSNLAAGPNGALRLANRGALFLFDGARWELEANTPDSNWTASEAGVFAVTHNFWKPIELTIAPPDRLGTQVVAHVFPPVMGAVGSMSATNGEFSAQSVLSGKPFLLGTNVALLCARGSGTTRNVQVTRKSSQYDLFVFGPAAEKPIQILIELNLAQGNAPAAPNGALDFNPYVVTTDDDILVGHRSSAGLWRISRKAVEDAIQKTVANPPAKVATEVKP